MSILITGSAGFIGFHTALKFLNMGKKVYGLDNINKYYDTKLKKDRIKILQKFKNFYFLKKDICNKVSLIQIFSKKKIDLVIHLAAQAGVRYSLTNPEVYIRNNINGFFNILETSKQFRIKHFVYASTSSVYGANKFLPFNENSKTDHPIQIYAATKKSNELMAHAYSSLYGLPTTGLRFFTVYGPWGRPDMALFKFTKNILKKKRIDVFNFGNHKRDFTYVDDIVNGIYLASKKIPKKSRNWFNSLPDSSSSFSPFRILNIGNHKPIKLEAYIKEIEKCLGVKSKKNYIKLQKGDIEKTFANINKIKKELNYKPKTNVKIGVKKFIDWFKYYYKIK